MKLISMTDFVLQQKQKFVELGKENYDNSCVVKSFNLMLNYAEFLRQPLTLGMFVPVDEKGEYWESPTYYGGSNAMMNDIELEKWDKAKEKVLFEGFSSTYNGFSVVSVDRIDVEDNYRLSFNKEGGCRQYYNIEELVMSDENFEIELTPSALKQIGL